MIVEDYADVRGIQPGDKTIVIVRNPREVFISILNECFAPRVERGVIHPSAIVHPEADIHQTVSIGPCCIVGIASIKANSVILPNVTINDGTVIGRDVRIHPGCVIGHDGFGYSRGEDGRLERFQHYGGVIIEDDVEIFALTNVDRGTLGNTFIGNGTKIDHHCHIGHNVSIGRNCVITACSIIGGSTTIGGNSWIAPNSTIRDCISLGEKCFVGMGAVVAQDVPDGTTVLGNPAVPLDQFRATRKALKGLVRDRQSEE